MSMIKCMYLGRSKSRSDDILLTGGFNLRLRRNTLSSKSCKDDTLLNWMADQMCRPCGTDGVSRHHRRLKPTVNKISSLRDYITENSHLVSLLCDYITENRHFAVDTTLVFLRKLFNRLNINSKKTE